LAQNTLAISTIYVWHRGGDTVGEVENAGWTLLGGVSMNSPSRAKLEAHMDNSYRYHQITMGDSLAVMKDLVSTELILNTP
jgi:hypothetical protein